MLYSLTDDDFAAAIDIINKNWQLQYTDIVNPDLLSKSGLSERANNLKSDFINHRLKEYVWKESGQVLAILSIGDTSDIDRPRAFEIWRIYVEPMAQRKGIGRRLINFAETFAQNNGYQEIVIWAFRENKAALHFYQALGYYIDKEEYLDEPYQAYGVRLLKKIKNQANKPIDDCYV